jgi:CBS-domain-containing membrane protein
MSHRVEKEVLIMQRVEMMIGPRDFATLKAEQFMQDVVSYYQVEDPADKLAGAMTEGGFGSVPILTKDRKVVGIVSEFDILQAISEGKDLAQVTAGEIMTRGSVSVTKETIATEIIQLLQDKHLIRVTVVDAQERLVGIVARRDFLVGYLRATKPIIWSFVFKTTRATVLLQVDSSWFRHLFLILVRSDSSRPTLPIRNQLGCVRPP